MALMTKVAKVTTTGAAGAATGSARASFGGSGRLLGVQIKYKAGQPGTTDVTIKAVLDEVEKTILTKTNSNTNVPMCSPQELSKDNLGADTAQLVHPTFSGSLTVDVADADAATDAVEVTFVVEV